MTERAARPAPAARNNLTSTLALGGAALLALALAYGVGRWQVNSAFSAYRDEQAQARQAATASAQQLQAENAALQGRVDLLEGRRQLHLALLALDARNFGMAKGHLDRAAALLAQAEAKVPAINREKSAALQRELAAVRLVASEDFSRQRSQIVSWARQWDALMPDTASGQDQQSEGE